MLEKSRDQWTLLQSCFRFVPEWIHFLAFRSSDLSVSLIPDKSSLTVLIRSSPDLTRIESGSLISSSRILMELDNVNTSLSRRLNSSGAPRATLYPF